MNVFNVGRVSGEAPGAVLCTLVIRSPSGRYVTKRHSNAYESLNSRSVGSQFLNPGHGLPIGQTVSDKLEIYIYLWKYI